MYSNSKVEYLFWLRTSVLYFSRTRVHDVSQGEALLINFDVPCLAWTAGSLWPSRVCFISMLSEISFFTSVRESQRSCLGKIRCLVHTVGLYSWETKSEFTLKCTQSKQEVVVCSSKLVLCVHRHYPSFWTQFVFSILNGFVNDLRLLYQNHLTTLSSGIFNGLESLQTLWVVSSLSMDCMLVITHEWRAMTTHSLQHRSIEIWRLCSTPETNTTIAVYLVCSWYSQWHTGACKCARLFRISLP